MRSCSCGYALRMRGDVCERDGPDSPTALGYDETYFGSPFYDYSEDRISMVLGLAGVRTGDNILDLGCGPGAVAVRCALLGARVYGADPSRAALRLSEKRAREAGVRLELFEFDGKSLPFRDSSFNSIIMADVAEHVDDVSLSCLFEECQRLLVPGGRLVLHTAPALEAMRICRLLRRLTLGAIDLQAGLITPEYEHLHVRYHSKESIRSLLRHSHLSPIIWGEVKYLKDRWPKRFERSLAWVLADQIWALAFKGPVPAVTFPEAPYLDAMDVPSNLNLGCCSEWALGRGLYSAEASSFRWTEKEAVLYLRSNEECSCLAMQISAPRPDLDRGPLKLDVRLDGKMVAALRLSDPGPKAFSIGLQGTIQPGLHKVMLAVDRTFVPRDWRINQDTRRLGIVVYSIGLK
jgi:ubiquinone/menaquinone biosynthesis C-methylase UbiE